MDATYEGYPAVVLRSDAGLEATFAPAVGMVGCSLRHHGEELLAQRGGLARYAASGSTFGIPLLHPWANRLAGFSYEAAGRHVEFDGDSPLVRLDPSGLPMHGLLAASPFWRITDRGADHLGAILDFGAHPELLEAFPFPHELTIDARLAGLTLSLATTLRPTGGVPVPISFGFHPYLRLPGLPREAWEIEVPARSHLLLDDRMIPTGASEPANVAPGPLGERTFDDAYAGLPGAPVFALHGGGRRVELRFGEGYPFAQVYAPPGEELICFEPMTAPTNALVSGDDLRCAHPGTTFTATFEICVAAE